MRVDHQLDAFDGARTRFLGADPPSIFRADRSPTAFGPKELESELNGKSADLIIVYPFMLSAMCVEELFKF